MVGFYSGFGSGLILVVVVVVVVAVVFGHECGFGDGSWVWLS